MRVLRCFGRVLPAVALAMISGWANADIARAEGSRLLVNEVPVVTFRAAGGSSQAKAAATRLSKLSSYDPIAVKKAGRSYRLLAAGREILIANTLEAKANSTSTLALATRWQTAMRKAISLPPIKLDRTTFRAAVGDKTLVGVVGRRSNQVRITNSDPTVARAAKVVGGLRIEAVGPGKTTVALSAGDVIESVTVEVLPFAATFPQTLSATITGSPATNETVRGAIEGAIRRSLVRQPGAAVQIQAVEVQPVQPGQAKTFAVTVKSTADGALPAQGIANVVVRNVGIALRNEHILWYCNDPENVKKPGSLFAAKLQKDAPARLLYHHINDSPAGLFLDVRVVNPSDAPASILLIPGDSDPHKNPVLAGLVAADMFVRNWIHYSGDIVTIPPRSSVPVSIRRLAPQETASGLATIRLLDGPDEVLIRTDARAPSPLSPAWAAALLSPAPWRHTGSVPITESEDVALDTTSHVYPDPYKTEDVTYEVGGPFRFIRIGQRPIANEQGTKNLQGNFGVIYNVRARLENRTEVPADVEVVFEASAGYSGALFVLNGEVKRTPLLQAKSEAPIVRVRMEPGSSRVVSFMTVPLSGSSYPATVTIRPFERGSNARTLFDSTK